MIISGGVNIYPQETENHLIMHPKVHDVAVIGVPNEDLGEEVKAVVVPAPGVAPGPELERELIAFCRDAASRTTSARARSTSRPSVPRTETGKMAKRTLREKYWAGQVEPARLAAAPYPRTGLPRHAEVKEDSAMSTVYERTIEVTAPISRAWLAFVDDREREAWMGAGRPDDVFEPGEVKLGPLERNRLVSWSQRQSGLAGWHDTRVRFEEVEGGTRITVTRDGFGDTEDWAHYAHSTAHGWDELLADLALYLETGVRGARHFPFRSGIGATTSSSTAGLRITHVVPGGFAEGAGLRAGDLLIRLGGATILDITHVAVLMREHAPGTALEAEYVRGREVLRGRAALSEWHHGTGEYVGHPGGYPKPKLVAA